MVKPGTTGQLRDPQLHVRNLARLVEVSLTLNSTFDVVELLQYILKSAAEILACETASLMIYDEEREELHFTAAAEDQDSLAKIPVPLDSSIAGIIFTENRPLIINDLANDPRHFSKVGEEVQFQGRNLIGVPMRIRDKVTGVLEGMNKIEGHFNNDDVYLLEIIASQSAIAIHNASLVQALRNANEDLLRQDKVKSDFLAIASHELRTPLGVILGYASFLKDETEEEFSQHAQAVWNSAVRMRSLVEDMTNLNFLRLGSPDLALQTIPIQAVIQSACEDVNAAVEAKSIQLALDLAETPLLVSAEAVKLKQVFVNLLSNAVRFTPEGGQVRVTARSADGKVGVRVQDKGIGISTGELDNIFEAFYQVDDHMTRRHGGLGLGLAIVKGMVEAHGGQVWAESEGLNKGATFTVVLPAV